MRLLTSPKDTEAGFTLVEIMVVVVIIGLLATVVVLNVLPSQDRARMEKARADIGRIEQAIEMFRLDMGRYPTTDEGLDVLVSAPADPRLAARFPEGGYINRLPEDPWGGSYQYMSPGEHGRFDVWSLGADARPGGEDNNADIGNWTAP
ncbi:type II secretion system protein GspG [Synechococcus moorigangaii CMS01]|nr:type II secretion system protein GspG [Synechococcus moorigangaii CMS01]